MSATWTNEPSGATNLLDHNFNVALGSGMSDYYHSINGQNPNDQLVDLNEGWQVSPTKCYRSRIEAGSNTGGTELQWANGNNYVDLFVGIAWKANSGFEGRPQGNKMFFVRGGGSNGVFLFGNSNLTNGSHAMIWSFNTSGLDNSHITGSTDPGVPIFPNAGSGTLTRGTGYKLEAYIKKSTSNTSRDGIIKWWINGIPAGSYTNVNYAGAGLSNWTWSETWDGTQNFTVTTAWEHYLDHLYISTGGTLGGGGTTPPPPDPTPPPQVVLSSLTPANQSTVVGTARQFTISMSGPVLTATSLFTTSSNTAVATVPASVTIAAGAATALVTATPVSVGSASISTSYNGVTKAATLQVGTSGSTTGSTVYDYSTQFSGTQGQDNWYYLEDDGTQMTYNGGGSVWVGTDTYGGSLQTIWGNGFHPGGIRPTVLRFVVPTTGEATITGSYVDTDTGGGQGVVAEVDLNGVTLFSRTINNGDTTGGAYSLTTAVSAGDHIEFVVSNRTGDFSYNSTSLNPVITLATTSAPPTPTPEPGLPASLVDLFTAVTAFRVGTPFSMTVRLSQIVTANTAVTIRVGSASVLTAPSSVTVLSGASEASFTVTPTAASLVAIEAELNGIRRVTLNVQPAPEDPPPVVEPGPATNPELPTTVIAIRPYADGAAITLNQGAKELAFKYDAQSEWVTIPDYQANLTTHVHRFTWPSGTTTICYRARALDGTWQESACAALPLPLPPPVPPAVNKSIIDKDGVRWQLTGKTSPYELKRNGSTMDHTYGVLLRKSGDGYVEVLQSNGVWIRRKNDAWEFVS